MKIIHTAKDKMDHLKLDTQFANDRKKAIVMLKHFLFGLFRAVVLIGISYVILSPVFGIIASSFFSDADNYNPMVFLIPQEPTLERYQIAMENMKYSSTVLVSLLYSLTLMIIQVIVCSMVGYGFARFQFPFKNLLFFCVVVMIIIPTNTIMLPVYMTFRDFNFFGLFSLFGKSGVNLLSTPWPMYIMTAFGCGLRSGLYIYIFNQFFRGLPKEIEEAAFVDGAGTWYTYFRIMLVNAIPSVITVAIFAMVWQYNDTFYAKLFLISPDVVIGKKISTLQANIANIYQIQDSNITQLYLDAGIVLVMLPVIIIYVLLQKYFIEGVERSGIVG